MKILNGYNYKNESLCTSKNKDCIGNIIKTILSQKRASSLTPLLLTKTKIKRNETNFITNSANTDFSNNNISTVNNINDNANESIKFYIDFCDDDNNETSKQSVRTTTIKPLKSKTKIHLNTTITTTSTTTTVKPIKINNKNKNKIYNRNQKLRKFNKKYHNLPYCKELLKNYNNTTYNQNNIMKQQPFIRSLQNSTFNNIYNNNQESLIKNIGEKRVNENIFDVYGKIFNSLNANDKKFLLQDLNDKILPFLIKKPSSISVNNNDNQNYEKYIAKGLVINQNNKHDYDNDNKIIKSNGVKFDILENAIEPLSFTPVMKTTSISPNNDKISTKNNIIGNYAIN